MSMRDVELHKRIQHQHGKTRYFYICEKQEKVVTFRLQIIQRDVSSSLKLTQVFVLAAEKCKKRSRDLTWHGNFTF